MRILMVFPYVTYPDILFETYIKTISKKNHEIIIITKKNDNIIKYQIKNKYKFNSIKLILIKCINFSFPYILYNFPIHLNVKSIINYIKPDIIHVNNLPFFSTVQYIHAAKKLNIPSIVHVHGVIGQKNILINYAQKIFLVVFSKIIFKETNLFICLTPKDAYEICKYGCDPNKIRVIPNGVDVKKFKPNNKIHTEYIYWGGRFVPEKGLKYLIEAIKLVKRTKSDIRLLMAGDGPLLPKIHKMINKYHLMDDVKFLGKMPLEKIPLLINSSSMCVLPSLKEGMPFALLEAMACGKPVIGSNISGIRDIINNGENGLLITPGDSKELASAILKLLEDKDLGQVLGRNARQLMIEKYSLNNIVNQIEQIYNELI